MTDDRRPSAAAFHRQVHALAECPLRARHWRTGSDGAWPCATAYLLDASGRASGSPALRRALLHGGAPARVLLRRSCRAHRRAARSWVAETLGREEARARAHVGRASSSERRRPRGPRTLKRLLLDGGRVTEEEIAGAVSRPRAPSARDAKRKNRRRIGGDK